MVTIIEANKIREQVKECAKLIYKTLGGGYLETVYEESSPICDPSYPDVCITPYPPDLDCRDIPYTDFRVLQPDPHGFDGDKDGIGCES